MRKQSQTINHPAFGECVAVPSIVAVKWRQSATADAVDAALGAHALTRVVTTAENATPTTRDPRQSKVNDTSTLSWATAANVTAETHAKLGARDDVHWTSPVFRASAAEDGPQSYFAVDPTVLLVAESAGSVVAAIQATDPTVRVNAQRTSLLKGFVVLDIPGANAIALADEVSSNAPAGSIKFENIPYLSPTTCGCGQTRAAKTPSKCAPADAEFTPDDPFFSFEWGAKRINAPHAWPITRGDAAVIVAVLDEGVELLHPDLNVFPVSYSTITHANDGSPVGNHGTACAGIIGGRIDNTVGVAGIAGNCPVMAIATNFTDVQVAEGLAYAADNGARVVSMSFGVYPSWMTWDFAVITPALQYCIDRGLVLCAASGNEDQNVARFPGSDPRTICVGGSNKDDVRKSIGDASSENWWGACYGPSLDVVAPCLEIPTTDRLGAAGYNASDYDMTFNGTSSATPHVAALAGLIFSANPRLNNADVRRIIGETCDKINEGPYGYATVAGKPDGTWNDQVGYGRINAERAVLAGCAGGSSDCVSGPCGVCLPGPDDCCVSPCDPAWLSDRVCLLFDEVKTVRVPLKQGSLTNNEAAREYLEVAVTYEHRLCLLGKQHGGLAYTVTLLPGETVTLYHSDRFRRVTSDVQRYSVQSTFSMFVSAVQQARTTNDTSLLVQVLNDTTSKSSESGGGGFGIPGLFSIGGSGASSKSSSSSSLAQLSAHASSDFFAQSVFHAAQFTDIQRSIVISSYEDTESTNVTQRTLHNANDCRAVTYFVRKVVEVYSVSTAIIAIQFRVVAGNVTSQWFSPDEIHLLPTAWQSLIRTALRQLPRVAEVVQLPRRISVPTDGVVYDPELAHCCSCEPEKQAQLTVALELQKAQALKACYEAKAWELENRRRELLLAGGNLAPFEVYSVPIQIGS